MYEVEVSDWFAAAHQLRMLDGTLETLHGHNWHVRVMFAGPDLDGMSVLLDFVALRARLRAAVAALHDQHLNDLPAFAGLNPSAEIVARHIAREMAVMESPAARLTCVSVEEAPGCVARYWP